jgi:hypothetical protein
MKIILMFFCLSLFVTQEINSQVIEEWVARYTGPGNRSDVAKGLAVDDSGNVYVTGYSSNGSDLDYATIKYNSDGDTLWLRRYNGQGYAIAVDNIGNVYVTGRSVDSLVVHYIYVTIKYNNMGDTLWVRSYNGPGEYDVAEAIALDNSGNVYITGRSEGDNTTIKYNSIGDTLWVRRYDRSLGGNGNAIAVDDSGNVYVTGGSDGDYTTIKYNSIGDTLWVRRYNGPANKHDDAYALAVDDSGNVYVTGGSGGIGTNYWDYLTIKYNSTGDTLWVRRYNGPGNDTDWAEALSVDPFGNVYITGKSDGNGTGIDYATIKYSSTGDTLWVRRYNNGPGITYDGAIDLAIDDFGNVYVTGISEESGSWYDYAILKYDNNGNLIWEMRYDGPGNGYDLASAIAVDNFGNVYVTGGSTGSDSFDDYATIKYSQTVGIEESNDKFIMKNEKLLQNQPNPFSTSTTIRYTIPVFRGQGSGVSERIPVHLAVYDITGRLIEILVDERQPPGEYQVYWDSRIPESGVRSGIYFYRLKTHELTSTKKMILLK